jgi:hypothetical protein
VEIEVALPRCLSFGSCSIAPKKAVRTLARTVVERKASA